MYICIYRNNKPYDVICFSFFGVHIELEMYLYSNLNTCIYFLNRTYFSIAPEKRTHVAEVLIYHNGSLQYGCTHEVHYKWRWIFAHSILQSSWIFSYSFLELYISISFTIEEFNTYPGNSEQVTNPLDFLLLIENLCSRHCWAFEWRQ